MKQQLRRVFAGLGTILMLVSSSASPIWAAGDDKQNAATGAASEKGVSTEAESQLPGISVGWAFKDKKTGKLIPAPARGRPLDLPPLPERALRALRTSSSGLVEQDVPGPAGGVRLDLQHRFRSALVATRTSEGRLVVGCLQQTVTSEASQEDPE